MNVKMPLDHMFCLKNWAVFSNTLKITVNASYTNGMPDKSVAINFSEKNVTIDGMKILVFNNMGKAGIIYIGAGHNSNISVVSVTLENVGTPVHELGLEYSIMSAMEAMNPNSATAAEKLTYDKIVFSMCSNYFDVNLSLSSCKISIEKPVEEKPVDKPENTTVKKKSDIIETIKADLKMMSYFGNSPTIINSEKILKNLLENGENMPENEVLEIVLEQEKILIDSISNVRADTRRYREFL